MRHTTQNLFIRCPCGKRLPANKMQSVNNELICPKCAKIHTKSCPVTVVLLDGTRLYFQPSQI